MTLRPALARLERVFKRLWAATKRRLGFNVPGWGSEPVNEDHATYRRQYEDTLALLQHLPRGVHHERAFERRNTILYFAELIDGLHNYGDDPIMPPGIRRVVVRETQRLAQFGPVGQRRRFFAAPAALALGGVRPWMIWTGAVVLLLGALGIQTGRIDSLKADLREARADIAQAERNLASARTERDMLSERAQRADQQARDTAQNYEAERARRLRTDRELMRTQHAINAANTDAPNDYGFDSVRSDGTTEPGAPGASGSTPAGNSR